MSAPTLREAAQAVLSRQVRKYLSWGLPALSACTACNAESVGDAPMAHETDCAGQALRAACDTPPPDVPEVRRQIARLLDRHERLLTKFTTEADRHIQRQELARLVEELVSLWERA